MHYTFFPLVLIYFAQNIVSDSQLKEMISNTIMYSKYPLFVGIDEEGGQVSRIANSSIEVTKVLTAAEIGEGDPQQAANAANSTKVHGTPVPIR